MVILFYKVSRNTDVFFIHFFQSGPIVEQLTSCCNVKCVLERNWVGRTCQILGGSTPRDGFSNHSCDVLLNGHINS